MELCEATRRFSLKSFLLLLISCLAFARCEALNFTPVERI
jgi:hypothetical protein